MKLRLKLDFIPGFNPPPPPTSPPPPPPGQPGLETHWLFLDTFWKFQAGLSIAIFEYNDLTKSFVKRSLLYNAFEPGI